MIGIYQDSFIDFLNDVDLKPKVSSKNIITACPWCEYGKDKNHYHMYISLEAPIFHCFHAECEKSGTLRKLLKKLEGNDISDQFIDKAKLAEFKKNRNVFVDKETKTQKIFLPPLNPNRFPNKEMYIKKRMKFFNMSTEYLNGLIYDVDEFIRVNQIPSDETLFRLKDYLHSNFVGFLTEHGTTVIFRNIEPSHSMRYYKLKIQYGNLLDYYKIKGSNPLSNTIVLAEGIFDILSEHIYNYINIKEDVKLYASALSSKYNALIKSITFHEQVFKPEVIILSDRGISLKYYKNLKKYNKYLFNSLTVYYNKAGKDFNDPKVFPVKNII